MLFRESVMCVSKLWIWFRFAFMISCYFRYRSYFFTILSCSIESNLFYWITSNWSSLPTCDMYACVGCIRLLSSSPRPQSFENLAAGYAIRVSFHLSRDTVLNTWLPLQSSKFFLFGLFLRIPLLIFSISFWRSMFCKESSPPYMYHGTLLLLSSFVIFCKSYFSFRLICYWFNNLLFLEYGTHSSLPNCLELCFVNSTLPNATDLLSFFICAISSQVLLPIIESKSSNSVMTLCLGEATYSLMASFSAAWICLYLGFFWRLFLSIRFIGGSSEPASFTLIFRKFGRPCFLCCFTVWSRTLLTIISR